MNRLPRAYRIAAFLLLCALVGCGRADRMTMHAVAGRLFVAGLPAGNANIFFYPCDPSQQRIPVGITAPDGAFRLTTIRPGDGAPEGRYDVTVTWPDNSIPLDECSDILHDRLKSKYVDRSMTELHAVIGPGKNEVVLRVSMPSGGWSFPRQRDKLR